MSLASTTLRIDRGARDRLAALSTLTGHPMGQLVNALSYADLQQVLQCVALQAAAEERLRAEERVRAELEKMNQGQPARIQTEMGHEE